MPHYCARKFSGGGRRPLKDILSATRERFEDLEHSWCQGDAVISIGFHSRRRERPNLLTYVDFGPLRSQRFVAPSGREYGPFQSKRTKRRFAAKLSQEVWHVSVRHSWMMLNLADL